MFEVALIMGGKIRVVNSACAWFNASQQQQLLHRADRNECVCALCVLWVGDGHV
jgi:hypothetical protein